MKSARKVLDQDYNGRPMQTDGVYCDCDECTALLDLKAAVVPFAPSTDPTP